MFKSVSYYVQQMYATNKGTNVLPLTMDGKPVAGQKGQDGLFASAVTDKTDGTVIVKVINTSKTAQPVMLNLNGLKNASLAATLTLTHDGMDDENTLDNPEKIVPREGTVTVTATKRGSVINDELPPMTFRIYKVKK